MTLLRNLIQTVLGFVRRAKQPEGEIVDILQEEEGPAPAVCPAILRVQIETDRHVSYHGYAMVGSDGDLVPGSFVITSAKEA